MFSGTKWRTCSTFAGAHVFRISCAASQAACCVVNFMKNGWMCWRKGRKRRNRCRTYRGNKHTLIFQMLKVNIDCPSCVKIETQFHSFPLSSCRMICRLPKDNALLLRYVLAMLHGIRGNAHENQMTSFNLSVCIAPSMLWPPGAPSSPEVEGEGTKKVRRGGGGRRYTWYSFERQLLRKQFVLIDSNCESFYRNLLKQIIIWLNLLYKCCAPHSSVRSGLYWSN